jgi:hypothetical protein
MKKSTDTGFIVSLHHDASPDALRINLKWQGDHDISAFDLDQLGQVLRCENETENTGWAIVKPSRLVDPGDAIPLRPLRKGTEILKLGFRKSSYLSLFQR